MEKGRVSALKQLGTKIKRSPKIVRKAIGNATQRLRVGKGKGFSDLKGCQENGWLYKDEDIASGVNYQVKYLGSVEVDFDPASSTNNQEHAQKAMRALRAHCKGQSQKVPKFALRVSIKHLQLTSLDGQRTVMRHSTTRIAYSTVDAENPKLFSYVAMVKDSRLTLCHIFKCATPKQGYEMTFVCAQAFDLNYRSWQSNRAAALEAAEKDSTSDIEPEKAWQKKNKPKMDSPLAKPMPQQQGGQAPSSESVAPERQTSEISSDDRQLPASLKAQEAKQINPAPRDPVFLAIMEGADPADLAADYFSKLGVNMVEEDDDADIDAAFTQLAQTRTQSLAPNILEVGVDTESYNKTLGEDNVGYVTVGPIDNGAFEDVDGYDSD